MAEVLHKTNTRVVPIVQKCLDYLDRKGILFIGY
jgi:hypothetical protein